MPESLEQWNSRRSSELRNIEQQRKIAYAAQMLKNTAEAALSNVRNSKNPTTAQKLKCIKNIRDAKKAIKKAEASIAKSAREVERINKQKPSG